MDLFLVLFILLFAIGICEAIMLGRWNATAFRSGIVILKRKIGEKQVSDIDVGKVQSNFGKSIAPSILFHKHDSNEIFFREKMISFTLFSYTPIMHGQIRSDSVGSMLIGRLNWSSVVFILVWYSVILAFAWGGFGEKRDGLDTETGMVLLGAIFLGFPILVFASLYAIQSYRFSRIAGFINE